MEDLQPYIRDIVEPTFGDFRRNPGSMRHAYLTCVATYHAVDRAAYPKSPGNLRKAWGRESFQLKIVDMVAHKFKHVISDEEKRPPVKGSIPLSHAVFGAGTLNTYTFNSRTLGSGGIDLHNLFYVVNEAIAFIKTKSV
jgi:hypothetical protein